MRYLTGQMMSIMTMSALISALSPIKTQAITFNEVDDAGENLNTAQVVSDSSSLEAISGTLSGFDDPADLFKIFLTGDQPFSATTVSSADFDTRLFLFDSDGSGIYFNDDASSGTLQSTLPANSTFTPTQSGIYYLGISGFDYSPVNTAGERIFPSLADFPVDVPAEDIFTEVFGATGPGGDAPLDGFDGAILNSGGSYTIALTGAAGVGAAAAVPEPSSILALLVIGGASGATMQLKKQKQQQQ